MTTQQRFFCGGVGGGSTPLGGFFRRVQGGWRKKKSGDRKISRGDGPACTHMCTRHGAIFSLVPREQSDSVQPERDSISQTPKEKEACSMTKDKK